MSQCTVVLTQRPSYWGREVKSTNILKVASMMLEPDCLEGVCGRGKESEVTHTDLWLQ